ncbi:MAG: 3-dehydroquinate synthase [Candidatus Westeberhardia cardiocondylae]|nr:3-dehydroquinate synthase [Candidatus Westeberhardia cardiocondylae]
MEKFFVKFKDNRNYPIMIFFGLFDCVGCFFPLVFGDRVMIITNTCLANLHLKGLCKKLIEYGVNVDYVVLPDGERYKSFKTLDNIFFSLLKKNHGRDTTILSFGGGVIGDISGFVASVYQRGVRLIHIPTTLLSQVDASIGGKTAVNHKLGKNMIGSFYQPSSVLIELNYLKTLSKREFSSGLSEIIKYAVVFDVCFFNWLENNLDLLFDLDVSAITYCIRKCCELKSNIVVFDEFEKKDKRSLLNFGHTYGHAIEAFMGYGNWLHGEAISVGMMIAMHTSNFLGYFSKNDIDRVKKLFVRANLPIRGPNNMLPKDYFDYMVRDKKNVSNKIRLVLPIYLGCAKIFSDVDNDIIVSSIHCCSN